MAHEYGILEMPGINTHLHDCFNEPESSVYDRIQVLGRCKVDEETGSKFIDTTNVENLQADFILQIRKERTFRPSGIEVRGPDEDLVMDPSPDGRRRILFPYTELQDYKK